MFSVEEGRFIETKFVPVEAISSLTELGVVAAAVVPDIEAPADETQPVAQSVTYHMIEFKGEGGVLVIRPAVFAEGIEFPLTPRLLVRCWVTSGHIPECQIVQGFMSTIPGDDTKHWYPPTKSKRPTPVRRTGSRRRRSGFNWAGPHGSDKYL